jgi:hypothetical protein
MKVRAWSTSVACLVAALLAAPSSSAASKHHKRKAKRPAAATVAPQPEGAADADDGESAPEPESAPVAPAPPTTVTRPEAAAAKAGDGDADDEAPPRPLRRPAGRDAAPAPAPGEMAAIGDDGYLLAVGRREAARLAAGRIEVAAAVGIDVGRRQFTYSDPIGAVPRPYLLVAAPLATFELEVYPLASSGIPVLSDLGFRGRVSRAFGLDSSTTNGVPLDNSWTRFSGELRGRVLVPGRRAFQLGISAGVDGSYFDLATGADVGALVPAARTLSFRSGADVRARVVGRFSLLMGGAYLATISRGEIYDRFRRPKVAGIDAELGVAFAVTPGLELRLNGRYTRYFASFDPEVGDGAVAGGALDQQSQLGVAVRYAH